MILKYELSASANGATVQEAVEKLAQVILANGMTQDGEFPVEVNLLQASPFKVWGARVYLPQEVEVK